jgi:hypothetical protein
VRKQRKPVDEASRETFRPRALTPSIDLSEYARDAEQAISAASPISNVRIALAEPALPDVDVESEAYFEAEDEELYWTIIGTSGAVPRLGISLSELRGQTLDCASGFVVAQIDGVSTVRDLIDVCGMPRLDVLRILCELAQAGVVTFLA